MELLAAHYGNDKPPPFANHQDMYNAIDSISVWEVPWQAFTVSHTGPKPVQDVLSWMEAEYTVWFRCPRELLGNQLSDRSFAE